MMEEMLELWDVDFVASFESEVKLCILYGGRPAKKERKNPATDVLIQKMLALQEKTKQLENKLSDTNLTSDEGVAIKNELSQIYTSLADEELHQPIYAEHYRQQAKLYEVPTNSLLTADEPAIDSTDQSPLLATGMRQRKLCAASSFFYSF
jgi:hypothetical protein